jgi:hypothetical protein
LVWLARVFAALAFAAAPIAALADGGPFANWAAVVIAGDYHAAHTDNPTETFDNARRDVAAELIRKGFSADNLRQFSVRPDRYPDTKPGMSDVEPIYDALHNLAQTATAGCLVYLTSHGSPEGVVVNGGLLAPKLLDSLVTESCGKRPTIVVISACFSGVFVPALADANRMIMTAADAEHSSFGCSEADKYPYFDTCVLQVLPAAHDFIDLGPKVQACVAEREQETHMPFSSNPQVSVGANLKMMLPLMAFAPG